MIKKTYTMLRCTTLNFAKSFLETGNLRFGKPSEWIEAANTYGEGRGDYLEGSFASCNIDNSEFIRTIHSLENDLINNITSNRCYFKRKNVLNLRTFCVFGINDDMFTSYRWSTQHEKRPYSKITLDYFNDFYNDVSEEEYDSLPEDKKPVVIMIKKPEVLVKRIVSYFTDLGAEQSELLVSPVQYIDMESDFLVTLSPPAELFVKTKRFSNQREIRFVLNTQNKDVLEKIEKSNGVVNIGNMSDIAEIYDYYFHEMPMMLLDKTLLFALPKSQTTPIDNPEQCIGTIFNALVDEVPQCQNLDETKAFIKDICSLLEKKFGYRCDSEKCIFTDLATGKTYTPDWYRISETLTSHAYNHYIESDYVKALDLYNRAILYSPSNAKYWYNRACCYIKMNEYKKALDDMKEAVKNSPNDTALQMKLKSYTEDYGKD